MGSNTSLPADDPRHAGGAHLAVGEERERHRAAVVQAGAARRLQINLLARDVRVEHAVLNWLPPMPVSPVSLQRPDAAAGHAQDPHARRRIPLERVDVAEVRRVRERDPVVMMPRELCHQRAQVRDDPALDVSRDAAADHADPRPVDLDRRVRARGRRRRGRAAAAAGADHDHGGCRAGRDEHTHAKRDRAPGVQTNPSHSIHRSATPVGIRLARETMRRRLRARSTRRPRLRHSGLRVA